MYCVHCGTEAVAKFCANCGKPVSAPAAESSHAGVASAAKPARKISPLIWRMAIPLGILFLVFRFVSSQLASVMPQ